MSQFYVEPDVLQRDAAVISRCAQGLGNQNDVLESVIHDGFATGSAYDTVMDRLRGISRQISYGQSALLSQHSALSDIADEYIRTENSILGLEADRDEHIGNIQKAATRGNSNSSENRDDSGSFFSWFKEGSLKNFIMDLVQMGAISYEYALRFLGALMRGDEEACREIFNEFIASIVEEGKADLAALIPHYLSNEGLIAFYNAISTGTITGNPAIDLIIAYYGNTLTPEEIAAHYGANRRILNSANNGIYTPGQMIENQGAWAGILYGKDSDYAIVNNWAYQSGMNNSGCGVIAVINALNSLGGNLSGEEVAQVIRDFETNGITMDGAIGTSPMAIYDYMRDKGYDAAYITSTDPSEINSFGNDYDTFIVTGYNNQDNVGRCLHTACITREADGSFTIHNSGDGSSHNYPTLDEAVSYLSIWDSGNSEPIMITGVR